MSDAAPVPESVPVAAPASVPESVPVAAPVPESVPKSVPKPVPTRQLLITCPLAGSPALDYLRDDIQEFLESQWFERGLVTVAIVPEEVLP